MSTLTTIDWVLLGLVASTMIVVASGIHSIRKEMRATTHPDMQLVKLKTTDEQRKKWRSSKQLSEIRDLLDDVDTLVRRVSEK